MSLPASESFRVGDSEYVDDQGRRWRLGFDLATAPPGVVWEPVMTWGYAKGLFGRWLDAELTAATWGGAKVL